MNRHKLFLQVQDYYTDLVRRLDTAQKIISMNYLAFEDGTWARRIIEILRNKITAGVSVRLMVDEIGHQLDEPRHILSNQRILAELRSAGVDVEIFRPSAPGTSIRNRNHCKFAAIDECTAFIGGSNIGDYYTTWSDTNIRVDGDLGDTFHCLFSFLRDFSHRCPCHAFDPSDSWAGSDLLRLTLPGQHTDIRAALLRLIRSADHSLFLRTWYFLPDAEIMDAICTQARKGVQVNLMLSHQTRMRLVDYANHIPIHQFLEAGGNVYRYRGTYLHSKAAWNNRGDVLLGSANLDAHSMRFNFESCLEMSDLALSRELSCSFWNDLPSCQQQSSDMFERLPFVNRAITHACYHAAPWL